MPASVRAQLGAALAAADDVADFAELRKLIVRAARATLRHAHIPDAEISVTLLDDAEIADMNARFLSHDGPTDVISFALYEPAEPPVGDVYIGWPQLQRQAATHRVSEREELARLTIHGVLHVLGHDHPDDERRHGSAMWRAQESILERVRLA